MGDSNEHRWTVEPGPGPVIATAIHDGHDLRPEVAAAVTLDDAGRLREEDPFTGEAVRGVVPHVIVHHSRFEVDLNRAPDIAVYRTPADCWGLELWQDGQPGEALVGRSRAHHADYYAMLGDLLDEVVRRHGRFVLLDVHSYNHRRIGPEDAPTPQNEAPDVNIGTFSMPRDRWAFLLDPLMDDMRAFDFNGRRLDVRENVAFQGKGYQTAFVHERYPETGCAIAIEFKKFFMDEWTGQPDPAEVAAMRAFMAFTADKARALIA